MNSIADIFSDITPFLDGIFHELEIDRIDVSGYELDHICYRIETMDEYTLMKGLLDTVGYPLKGEHIIGGRPISTYKLNTPIRYHERRIGLIELPAPKIGSPYRTGWEHTEFVIDGALEDLKEKHRELDWDTGGYQKSINRDICRKYENGTSAKFHEQSLEYIIMELE